MKWLNSSPNLRFARFSTINKIDHKKDYYRALGLKKSAEAQDIRKAFFDLAKKYHPDLNTEKRETEKELAKIKFLEINEAY